MADLTSRPYQPDPDKCCDRCVFGRGEHADWCVYSQPASQRPDFWVIISGTPYAPGVEAEHIKRACGIEEIPMGVQRRR